MAQAIGTRQRAGRDNGYNDTIGCIGPSIVQEDIAHGQQDPVIIKGIFYIVNLAALLISRNKMLSPIFDPLHRATQPQGRERSKDLLGIEHHNLRPEAATHIGSYHTYLVLWQAEHRRQAIADRNRPL